MKPYKIKEEDLEALEEAQHLSLHAVSSTSPATFQEVSLSDRDEKKMTKQLEHASLVHDGGGGENDENNMNDAITIAASSPDQDGDDEVEQEPKLSLMESMKKYGKREAIEMFQITWPIILNNVFNSLLGTVDIAFVGHLGKEYLAAAALGNAYFMCIGFIPNGLLAAQDTMISQAEGMKNEHVKRIVLYRSFFLLTLVTIPVALMFWFSKQILTMIGQDADISALSGTFNRYLTIGIYPFVITCILSRYLTAQGKVIFPMICTIIANLVNAFLNYFLITGIGFKGLGFIGAPLATSFTRIFICIAIVIYTIYVERKQKSNTSASTELDGEEQETQVQPMNKMQFLKETFKGTIQWKGCLEYLKLAIPGMFMLMLEIWGFEFTTILSGYLPGPKYTAGHSITLNIIVPTFMIPLSISIACAIRVGICLGAKEANKARVVSVLTVICGMLYMTLSATLLFALRYQLGKIFTKDEEVLKLVAVALPVCALFQIVDGAQVCLAGILRGMGKQLIGAITNMIAFYILGLPAGALLAFYFKLHLIGLWSGLAIGLTAIGVILAFYIGLRVNFEDEVRKAHERIAKSDTQGAATAGATTDSNEMESQQQNVASSEEDSELKDQ